MTKIIASGYSNKDSIGVFIKDTNSQWTKAATADADQPSYLEYGNGTWFAALEHENDCAIAAYRIENEDGKLELKCINSIKTDGSELCHLYYQSNLRKIIGSCYGSGNLIMTDVWITGKMSSDVISLPLGEVEGKPSKFHCAVADKDSKKLFTANIGHDRIYCHEAKRTKFTPSTTMPFVQLDGHKGVRQLKIYDCSSFQLLIAITEYSNEILTFKFTKTGKTFEELQTISTLAEGFCGESFGGSIAINKNAKCLYASNRGANTIAVFSIAAGGLLTKIQDIACGGDYPRHIAFIESENCLMCANQRSDTVTSLLVADDSGMLDSATVAFEFEKPSFVSEA